VTARACAHVVLRRVFEQGAWADRTLQAEADRMGLTGRDRSLAMALTYGAVQRRATLDHVIERLAGRPVSDIDPPLVAALRLGVLQLAYMDRIPAHAAVTESVELAKRDAPRGAGLVNAVLRRAAREARAIVEALPDRTPEEAALKHSHPLWIAELWFQTLGPEDARALMAADNRAAEAVLRANTLKTTPEALRERIPSEPVPDLPEALVLTGPFDAHGDAMHAEGLYMPQSRAAMAVAHALGAQPGERVLDLCAAPGGKTTHLAALMGDDGEIVAVEANAGRARALERTAKRMGASIVTVRNADARTVDEPEAYDRVLVDPPCSDLGTLASRPDARWHKGPGDPARLAEIQGAILRAGAATLRPGGTLVYSTCTISPAENEGVVDEFLAQNGGFELLDTRQTLPHRDGTDGFFIARLRKTR
jgi:16S rRNA (cytosine967-C5)-methyltransferase